MYAETGITIRRPTEEDVEGLAELIYRFYTLNGEFDPSWAAADNLRQLSSEEAKRLVSSNEIVLVAVSGRAVVGYVRAAVEENRLLRGSRVVTIKELYVRPEERRAGVATSLVERVRAEARRVGADYVAVEFPTGNFIAQEMYSKMGFRPYQVKYIREV